jgi:formate-dependent nitrite reductase cytochrome c552 subunit
LKEEIASYVEELETVQDRARAAQRGWADLAISSNPIFLRTGALKAELADLATQFRLLKTQKTDLLKQSDARGKEATQVERQIAAANAELMQARETSESAQTKLIEILSTCDITNDCEIDGLDRDLAALESRIHLERVRQIALKKKLRSAGHDRSPG